MTLTSFETRASEKDDNLIDRHLPENGSDKGLLHLVFLIPLLVSVSSAAPSGYIIGWGDNSIGTVLGTPTMNPPNMSNVATGLVRVADQIITNAIAIAAGGGHGLALTTTGIVVGWGGLSLGDEKAPPFPTNGYVHINGKILTHITGITASSSIDQQCFDLAVTREGRVIAWGGHEFRQTAPPSDLNHVTAIAAGVYQGLALTEDGTIVTGAKEILRRKG